MSMRVSARRMVGMLVSVCLLATIGLTAAPASAENNAGEPAIAHVPAITAWYGQAIPIDVTSTCVSGSACAVRLYFRTSAPAEGVPGLAAGAWSSVDLTGTGTTSLAAGREAQSWTGDVPGTSVTTTGVDYFLEAFQDASVNRLPASIGGPAGESFFHVATVSPPLLQHVPPLYAYADRSLLLEVKASCSTGKCHAKLWYRESAGQTPEDLTAPVSWPNAAMRLVGTAPAPNVGSLLIFQSEIPASVVTTNGVDYFIEVRDGHTTSWWPGTTYQGYYAPRDGMRTGYHHVHVLEPSSVVTQPLAAAPYRQDIPISAHASCPSTRECTSTLYYRTTVDPAAQFATSPMTVTKLTAINELDLIEIEGTIPASVVDTRGVDYLFRVDDGATTTWWPGTRRVDGYAELDSTSALWHHIRVLEPPHILTQPVPAAPPLQPYSVSADVTCATESCSVRLHYFDRLVPEVDLEGGPVANVIEMQPQGTAVDTPLGDQQRYQAAIPAEQVTTRGLAYYIEAFDGYTHEFAPGTTYWGAYVPTDGQSVGEYGVVASFPVRVLEPPHIVHTPPAVAPRSRPLALSATSNCSSPACTATLAWMHSDGSWVQQPMTAQKVADLSTIPPGFGALWEYHGTIPPSGTGGDLVSYRFVVDDGYVGETSPTFVAATQTLL